MKDREEEISTIYTSRNTGEHNQARRQGNTGGNLESLTGGGTERHKKHKEMKKKK